MGAANALSADHRVVLIEAEPRIGGHARTRMAGPDADDPVDTGFIVFNYANYPELTALFDDLDVPVAKSNMSFGASFDGGKLEYALASLNAMFAQRSNLFNPRFLRMCRDILRFNARGFDMAQDPRLTVAGLLDQLGTGNYFRDRYLLPFTGAIWSTPKEQIMEFPAQALLRFMHNHALLDRQGQHQWYTVAGGSQSYVSRLEKRLKSAGVEIRTGTPVAGVRRSAIGVELRTEGGEWEVFDDVIFATHSDDSLRLLSDPSDDERAILGAIRYQPNDVVLHSDESIMPKSKSVWSSWVYSEAAGAPDDRIDITYWMNSLQPWQKQRNYFVSLNCNRKIREDLIWDQTVLRHPVYDLAALAAQDKVAGLNGQRNTWYCGAWVKNGFHEDGLTSGLDVVRAMQARAPIAVAAE